MFQYKKLHILNYMHINFWMQRHDYTCMYMQSYYYLYTYSNVMSSCPHVHFFLKKLLYHVSLPASYPCPVFVSMTYTLSSGNNEFDMLEIEFLYLFMDLIEVLITNLVIVTLEYFSVPPIAGGWCNAPNRDKYDWNTSSTIFFCNCYDSKWF